MKRTISSAGGFRPPFKRPLPAASSSDASSAPAPPPIPAAAAAAAAALHAEDDGSGKENVAVAAVAQGREEQAPQQPPAFVAPPSMRRGFIAPTKGGGGGLGARPAMPRQQQQQPQAPSQPQKPALMETKRFKAQYTKNTQKKKKIWSEGVLVVDPSPGASAVVKVTLESESGKVEGRKALYNGEGVGEGTELIIGNYMVTVGAPRKPGAGPGGVDTAAELLPLGDAGGGSFASRFMTKGELLKPKAKGALGAVAGGGLGAIAGAGMGSAGSAAATAAPAPLVPRVVKEGELLLCDPAVEQQQPQQRLAAPSGTRLGTRAVVVDATLGRALRPHQREGVAFLWRCLTGRGPSRSLGRGAILADDMGLGKTLQTITTMYTMLRQSPYPGQSDVLKAIVVTPSSLLGQWSNEIKKWLHYKIPFAVVDAQLGKATGKGGANEQINTFITSSPAVCSALLISYETYRINAPALNACKEVGLLVCDEAHRLKAGNDSKTMAALSACPARARLLLTGTPVQNDLNEFFSLADFCNPGCFGKSSTFKAQYANPIQKGRDPRASQTQQEFGQLRSRELMSVAKAFLLRRTAAEVLRALIPPKHDYVLFCRLTPLQRRLYEQCTRVGLGLGGPSNPSVGLRLVDVCRKLCNSPAILLGPTRAAALTPATTVTDEEVAALFSSGGGGGKEEKGEEEGGGGEQAQEQEQEAAADPTATSSKLGVLDALLAAIHAGTNERVVVVSSFTSALDVVGALCTRRGWRALRLDGSVAQAGRTRLVEAFNSNVKLPLDAPRAPTEPFVFLLSSRAGGQGLNLIGGSRLVLFDTEWNPAQDKQVKGRVWRDGQRRPCFIYRLLCTGSIEEKMYMRQIAKNELHNTIMEDAQHDVRNFSHDDLKRLFVLAPERVCCETYDTLSKGGGTGRPWADYTGPAGIQDACLRTAASGEGGGATAEAAARTVSFVHKEQEAEAAEAANGAAGVASVASAASAWAATEGGGGGGNGKRRVVVEDEDEENEEESEDEWMEAAAPAAGGKSEGLAAEAAEPAPIDVGGDSGGIEQGEIEDDDEWDELLNR